MQSTAHKIKIAFGPKLNNNKCHLHADFQALLHLQSVFPKPVHILSVMLYSGGAVRLVGRKPLKTSSGERGGEKERDWKE